jgi:hypothetical protein
MTSVEKVRHALDRAEAVAGKEGADVTLQIAAAGLSMFRGTIEKMIPEDPVELDDLLERGANWMLELRSDLVVTG